MGMRGTFSHWLRDATVRQLDRSTGANMLSIQEHPELPSSLQALPRYNGSSMPAHPETPLHAQRDVRYAE